MSWIKLQSEYHDLDKYDNCGDIVYHKKYTNIRHNPYGPAYISIYGYQAYWINNKRHRLDGPAKIYKDGYVEYYINGLEFTKEEFEVHPERLKYLGKEYLICLG